MQVVFLILLFVVGSCVGSYLCCQVRRMRLENATKGKSAKLGKRSLCLGCNYQLKWYDNIPILSWMFLRGRCRKCGKMIGLAEILSEIGMGVVFLMIGTTVNVNIASGLDWAIFGTMLLLVSTLGFLAIYDGLYGEMPMLCLTIAIICAIIVLILKEWSFFSITSFESRNILEPLAAVGVLGGLYLLLYIVSKGKWVGDGDWIVGVVIGLALGSPWLAVIALFIANLLACLIMAPVVRKTKNKRIYFGPFMVMAFVITYTFAGFFCSLIGG